MILNIVVLCLITLRRDLICWRFLCKFYCSIAAKSFHLLRRCTLSFVMLARVSCRDAYQSTAHVETLE